MKSSEAMSSAASQSQQPFSISTRPRAWLCFAELSVFRWNENVIGVCVLRYATQEAWTTPSSSLLSHFDREKRTSKEGISLLPSHDGYQRLGTPKPSKCKRSLSWGRSRHGLVHRWGNDCLVLVVWCIGDVVGMQVPKSARLRTIYGSFVAVLVTSGLSGRHWLYCVSFWCFVVAVGSPELPHHRRYDCLFFSRIQVGPTHAGTPLRFWYRIICRYYRSRRSETSASQNHSKYATTFWTQRRGT